MLTEEHTRLIDLSRKILNEKGREDILDFLSEGNDERARIYLYAAVDSLVDAGKLNAEEAAEHFKLLNLDRAMVERLRQKHAANG